MKGILQIQPADKCHHESKSIMAETLCLETQVHPPQRPLELAFTGITVSIGQRQILKDVSGFVKPGQLLAIMGPSGCGKTTLLNCLAGRVKLDSGNIRLNRERMNKKWKRRICYVLQQDIFFPDLTLRQTLEYAALLRLPDTLSKSQKMMYVDHIIDVLDLGHCQNTIIGAYLKRGLSGGEKKRANIACELLTNPSLMLLDEPTSGLDSHTAYSLMCCLKRYAEKEGKTVVVTVHQPSSQTFHMFDKVLLLCKGQIAYFGDTSSIPEFFAGLGLSIKPHYNPADFILEQVGGSEETKEKLIAASRMARIRKVYLTELHPDYFNEEGKSECDYKVDVRRKNSKNQGGLQAVCVTVAQNTESHQHIYLSEKEDSGKMYWLDNESESSSDSCLEDDMTWEWPTTFWTQFKVLCHRNYQEARPRMLSKMNWIQTVGLSLMAGLLWFQLPRTEESLHDIQGWMFFSTTYWMLFAHFDALNSFPPEREVINKERQSGAYRLLAYYLAKMVGEVPLTITLPAVYHIISYPMMGLHSFSIFINLLGILLLNTIVAQSVGLFIGACYQDHHESVMASALYTQATQLFGGFLATRLSFWIKWLQRFNMIHYAYQNMQIVEFSGSGQIKCASQSKYEVCKNGSYIPVADILEEQGTNFPLWANTLILLFFLVIFRVLGYVVLRYFKRPQ